MDKVKLQEFADFIRTVPQDKFRMSHGEHCVIGHINKKYGSEGGHLKQALGRSDFDESIGFIIDSRWEKVDNSVESAAKRIEYIIQHETPPVGWRDKLIKNDTK